MSGKAACPRQRIGLIEGVGIGRARAGAASPGLAHGTAHPDQAGAWVGHCAVAVVGVAAGNCACTERELHISRQWSQLAEQAGLDLVVCISAAQRRGLLCLDEAARQGKQDDDLAPGFRIAGLGQWLEATLLADRCIVFA